MSVGSDPIECCVRGRFLCVCVTARRRGFRGGGLLRRGSEELPSACFAGPFRLGFGAGGGLLGVCGGGGCGGGGGGGLLRRGSEKLLSTCFARLSGIGFAAGGGSARASFSRCAAHFGSCRLFAVGLLRRGSEKLLSTCFARLPGIGFAAGGGSARASSSRALRISVRGSCRFFAARPSSDHGRWPDFVRSAPRQGGRAAGGTASSLYASAAGVLAGGFLVPAGFGRKCGSHSTGRKRAACCGPFGPGRCLRRDPRPKRTDRLSRYGRDNVGRARGSGCRKTCRGAVRTLPASRCGR